MCSLFPVSMYFSFFKSKWALSSDSISSQCFDSLALTPYDLITPSPPTFPPSFQSPSRWSYSTVTSRIRTWEHTSVFALRVFPVIFMHITFSCTINSNLGTSYSCFRQSVTCKESCIINSINIYPSRRPLHVFLSFCRFSSFWNHFLLPEGCALLCFMSQLMMTSVTFCISEKILFILYFWKMYSLGKEWSSFSFFHVWEMLIHHLSLHFCQWEIC